jgi:Predicted Zn-dependent protease
MSVNRVYRKMKRCGEVIGMVTRRGSFGVSSIMFALAAITIVTLSGCGGGGGGSAAGPLVPDSGAGSSRLQPNYVASLTRARRWEKPAVSVYIEDAEMAGEFITGSIRSGLSLWKSVPGTPDVVFVGSPDGADITVRRVPKENFPGMRIGFTKVTFVLPANVLKRAEIELADDLAGEALVQVAAHEMGHALGLDGHSENEEDMMFAITHLPARLTERDDNTMEANYLAPARRQDPGPSVLETTIAQVESGVFPGRAVAYGAESTTGPVATATFAMDQNGGTGASCALPASH